MAKELYDRAKASGSPVPQEYGIKGSNWQSQVRRILNRAQNVATTQQERVLLHLGVTPIWYDYHEEISGILKAICPRLRAQG